MKKLIFLLLLNSSALMAQEAYNAEFEGKFLPAKILLGDGTIYSDPLMKYQQPEYYKNPLNRFTISLGSESEAYEPLQGTIIAFKINNTVWAGSTIKPGEFVIYNRQGAIEQIWTVNNGEMGSFKKEKIDAYIKTKNIKPGDKQKHDEAQSEWEKAWANVKYCSDKCRSQSKKVLPSL